MDLLSKKAKKDDGGNCRPYKPDSRAPYNFVPLNKKIVPAEEIPAFNKYHENKHTGYIEIEIQTLTPIYIRDTIEEKEFKEKKTLENSENINMNPDFFSPGGILRIPGSSLRGLVRTMVEITGFGKISFLEADRKFHYRSFADKSIDLRNQYKNKMLSGNQNSGHGQKIKAGYLIREGLDYYIKPAQIKHGTQFFRVEEGEAINRGIIKEKMSVVENYTCIKHGKIKQKAPGKCPECKKDLIPVYKENPAYKPGFKEIKFTYEAPQKHMHSKPLFYAKVTDIWERSDRAAPQNAIEGVIVLSKWMRGPKGKKGKHLHWVIGPEDNNTEKLKILPEVISDYENDLNRDKNNVDLLKLLSLNPEGHIPCFYIEENGKVKSFGHTGLFRIAYDKTLKEFLPPEHLNINGLDLAEAIFGKDGFKGAEDAIASRVFFENALLVKGQENVLLDAKTPKILSTPKPTSFQHYLEQGVNLKTDDKENIMGLKTYNDDTLLRGHKQYWHKDGAGWEKTDRNKVKEHASQYTKIKPVRKDIVFRGIIRFENLSRIELGALLFALDLPTGCAHKIGMGKPLGLGSIRITPKLFLSNRKERYKSLLAEWEGYNRSSDIKVFKEEFEQYVLQKLGESANSLWELERMKQLKVMLDFNKKPSNIKTTYLDLAEFRKRRVLPRPIEIV